MLLAVDGSTGITPLDMTVGVGVAILLLRLVFDFLRPIIAKANGGSETDPTAEMKTMLDKLCVLYDKELTAQIAFRKTMYMQVKDLWDWHNIRDSDGVPVWYVRKSLEDAIKELSNSIRSQTLSHERVNMKLDQVLIKLDSASSD